MKLGLAISRPILSTSYLLVKPCKRIGRPIKANQKVVPETFDYMILTILRFLRINKQIMFCIVMIIITRDSMDSKDGIIQIS
jgi:hypothetical protein